MKEQIFAEGEMEKAYQKRRIWARAAALRLGVELSEGGEFFLVPVYDKEGNVARVEHVPTRIDVPICNKEGKVIKVVPSDKAVEAIQKYPNESFSRAVEMLEAESKK